MANLQFETSIVGVERVKSALASLETRFQRLNMALLKANNFANKIGKRVDPMAKTAAQEETKMSIARMREDTKLAIAGKREQERAHRDNLRRIRTENRERERAETRIARMRAKTFTDPLRRAGGNLFDAAKGAGAGAALGAAGFLGAAMRDMINKKAITAGIANEMKTPDERRSLKQIQEDITTQFDKIAKETGMSFEEIATGYRSAIGVAGRGRLFQNMMPAIATISDYGNSSVSDMGKAAGHIVAMLSAKGITGDKELQSKTLNALVQMTEQAKKGNINMDDFSRTMAVITAASGQFGGDPIANLIQMSGMAQFAVETGGAKGPEEAGTAALRMSADLVNAADTIKKEYGINVFDDQGMIRASPAQMAEAMIVATKGNQTELGKIFQGESIKIVRPLLQEFLRAGGGEAGRKALRSKMGTMENMPVNPLAIVTGANFRASQPDRELTKAWENFVEKATPSLETFLNDLIPLLPQITTTLISMLGAFKYFSNAVGLTKSPVGLLAGAGIGYMFKEAVGLIGQSLVNKYLFKGAAGAGIEIGTRNAAARGAAFMAAEATRGTVAQNAARGAGQAGFATVGAMGGIAAGVVAAGIGFLIGKEIANSFWDEVQARSDKTLMSSVNASVVAGGSNLTSKQQALAQITGQLNAARSDKNSWSGQLGDWYEGASGTLSNIFGYTDGPIRISSEENIAQLERAKADLEASIKKQQADVEAAKASDQLKTTTQRASAALSSLVEATDKVKERFGNLTQNPVPIADKSRGGR